MPATTYTRDRSMIPSPQSVSTAPSYMGAGRMTASSMGPKTQSAPTYLSSAARGSTPVSYPATGGSGGGAWPTGAPQDPFGYFMGGGKKGKNFGGHKFLEKMFKNAPPWLQDPRMFQTATGSIMDILNRKGAMSPEGLIRQQASIETGRQQGQDAVAARLAAGGIDPASPLAQTMGNMVDMSSNRGQVEARRDEELRREQQMREDLNLAIPYLQAILGFGTKSGGNVQAAPTGGGGGGMDWSGAVSNMLGSALQGWGQSGFQKPNW